MKKYNRSEIMKTAHTLRKHGGISMGHALRKAWAVAKAQRLNAVRHSAKRVFELAAGDIIVLYKDGPKYYDTTTSITVIAAVVKVEAYPRMTVVRYADGRGGVVVERLYTDGYIEIAA